MSSYSPERKAALIKKLLPPQNLSVAELARQEGIAPATLYTWRTKLKAGGAVPVCQPDPIQPLLGIT
jgi:transposase-like protein